MPGFNWGSYEDEKQNMNYCPPAGSYMFELSDWQGTRTAQEKGARPMVVWSWRLQSEDDEKADGYVVKDYTVADDSDPDSCGKFHDTVTAILQDRLDELDPDDITSEKIVAGDVPPFDDALGTQLWWSTKQEDFQGQKRLKLSRPLLDK